ncbi:2'-5' RNA ligase family protein [Saccharothrix longispora]|uniref:2'-5' RNA ligase family protein n=1 Tax=Saccharothrix longispora TaxID=33920 RepID=UPI0028FD122E|nr:2'-5' RNA ligase family protein [Saccharothrix longispora]MDU0294830.1 2'-5' RNA ligase family protein [Saccharothrix longispora]
MTEYESMRDHWWWRPGWRVGRSFYTWHITFADQPAARRLVAAYAPVLDRLPQLDPVPLRWLHLTLQGIGFTDEVDRRDVDDIVSAARKRCADLEPFTVTLGPAHVDPETIQLPTRPLKPLAGLRSTIRAAIGDVRGPDNVPEPEAGFRAHVSLGYSNAAGPADPIAEALHSHEPHTAEIAVTSVSLIDLNRDHKSYEWTDVATVSIGHH